MNKKILNNESTTHLIQKLKSAEKQYPTLSFDEERKLIEKYRNDRDKLNELLFFHNIRSVFNICKKYALKTNDFDNMVMEGFKGLSVACKNFDIDRKIKFITFATKWIFKYVIQEFYHKSYKVIKSSISLDGSLKIDNDDADVTLENYLNKLADPSVYEQTVDTSFENKLHSEDMENITKVLYNSLDSDSSLSVLDKSIFKDMFMNNIKPKELSMKYNVNTTYITKVKKTIIKKFKEILNKNYNVYNMNDIM